MATAAPEEEVVAEEPKKKKPILLILVIVEPPDCIFATVSPVQRMVQERHTLLRAVLKRGPIC